MDGKKAKKRTIEEVESRGRTQQKEDNKDSDIRKELLVKKRKKEEHKDEEGKQRASEEEINEEISDSPEDPEDPGPSLDSSLSLERFTFHRLLGKGGYGKVFLASDKTTKKVVALKIVRKKDLLTEASDRTLTERRVLEMAAGSPYLTKAYGAFQIPTHLCYVLEYLHGGDLDSFLKRNIRLEPCIAIDIKPRNIMLDEAGHIRIGDFGLALEMHGKRTAKGYAGTVDYMAPEMRKGRKYNAAVDWWAYGLILHKLAKRAFPKNPNAAQTMLHDTTDHPECQRKQVKDLVKKLLCKNPSQRLGAASSIQFHPFFQSIDWDDLEAGRLDPPFVLRTPPLESLISRVIQETLTSRYEAFTPSIPPEQQQFLGFSFNTLS
ncbi:kinase C theta type isoform X3 [Pelobates cultripes]|uniref:Kinase C theta type isoform X3 n=1 Tax=Pelobates cultripes TaxID=61616 RepID=A0AAD1VW98_PELCU|nr:kinase C theta type isoform X3 [Pelobates cultripes]